MRAVCNSPKYTPSVPSAVFFKKIFITFQKKRKKEKKSMLKPIKTTKGWKAVMFVVVVGIVLGVEVVVVVQSWREEGVGGCSNTE